MSGYLPDLPYLVMDQNRCRDRAMVQRLFRRCKKKGWQILLPDTAFYEFSNVSRPDITWRRSLEHLCQEPSLVVVGRSLVEIMREEVATGRQGLRIKNYPGSG